MTEFLDRIDTIFFGRKSYEQLTQHAPTAFLDKKKVVFSKTIKSEYGNFKVISENIEEAIQEIRNQPGKDIWLFGGGVFASNLLNLNLVDELMISVHPLILGKGKPLFVDIPDRIKLKLMDNKTFSSGLVQLFYAVER